ncbi:MULTISPECIES: HD domain-containing phosphohydrolase [Methylomonas]|uniref:Histidine kinase n=2 Tax=Methylomonas TaxID=416 RepID=A0A126T8D2_9GAMM|nr:MULTISPECIES: HD domain-containing phosphohydrolase [Methylomonas]AMK78322.1 histidine kinase [Methylomonas denitrificans]OAI04036.1 histidine kinase [Methylomonas methanica]TCV87647.1 response regulator RpfG family c-di-GMP phosphodiesterase [Methylomonas methanica]
MTELSQDTHTIANLLFVDDEPNVLKALRRLFRGAEYQVYMAEGGADGLEILQQHPIDLIISDMRMPHMDGAEFLTRAAERWPDCVRILLTGYADLESTIAAVNNGKIYSYFSKPWEDNELKILVNNALEQKRLREERRQLFDIINRQNQELKELNAGLEEKVEKRTEQLRKSLQMIDQAHDALKKQYADSVKVFAKTIEMRPGIKSGHAKYVAENAREVGRRLGMDAAALKDLVYAGLLLQIGKMSLPDSLLNQSLLSMNSLQRKRYLNHALEGQSLLKGLEPLHNAAELIAAQYEHFDGSGQPLGLSGGEIPLGARILMLVRDYINYLDGSITGTAMTTEQVKARLRGKKTKDYDPLVVDTFLALLTDSETSDERPIIEISWTQLKPGMEAAEIICNEVLYLKNQILSEKNVEDILQLRKHAKHLILRIRMGSDQQNS